MGDDAEPDLGSQTHGRWLRDGGSCCATRSSFLITPDGRYASGDVATYLLEGGRLTKLVQDADYPAWTPDGKGFVFVTYDLGNLCSFYDGAIYLRARVRAAPRSGCSSDPPARI